MTLLAWTFRFSHIFHSRTTDRSAQVRRWLLQLPCLLLLLLLLLLLHLLLLLLLLFLLLLFLLPGCLLRLLQLTHSIRSS